MNNQFCKYDLSKEILESLTILNYTVPTKIQEQVLPEALSGRDVVGRSQTGSGKTAAFAIPLCEEAIWEENTPTALVLEPTRELTMQTKQELYLIGRKKRLKVPDLIGGFPIEKQIQSLKQKSHIVVGTPGRILDHILRGTLSFDALKSVVIDEADLMLDMGFFEDVKKILDTLKKTPRIMLFSATIEEPIKRMIEQYLKNPVFIAIEDTLEEQNHIRQEIYEVEEEDKEEESNSKYKMFLHVLAKENPDSCMIFCGTKEMVNVLCRKLRRDGVKAGMIHGDIDQQDRIRTVEGFREGRFRYLIATDVVARGIDFDRLSHVFNYDFPTGRETYVHRIGRTGRNGETGTAISFVTSADQKMKRMVETYVGYELPINIYQQGTAEEEKPFWDRQKEKVVLKKKKGEAFQQTIMKLTISGGKKSKMRAVDIVGTICSIDGILAEDIGAIDVRDSITYVEILNGKGDKVLNALQVKTIKGKIRKVRKTR
ncbi:DEAD/DEAH box helicase [Anaerosporobacter faecicola]|uniref:DEAD/DEAH box helicase n=1 Tax=Anaerosporobacter faecicola TaxID=2718714 RepID=UPI00143C4A93|nr:DEAD/DEAH box helicase [Anaerosporobacter faecicola]